MTRRPERGDEGTVLLLTLAYVMLALTLVLGVTDVSALLLARRGMQAVADGAALSVAQDVSVAGLYGSGRSLALADDATLQSDAERYVARSDLPDADVRAAGVAAGDTVVVALHRAVRLPFGALLDRLGLDGVQDVTTTAHARLSCLGC